MGKNKYFLVISPVSNPLFLLFPSISASGTLMEGLRVGFHFSLMVLEQNIQSLRSCQSSTSNGILVIHVGKGQMKKSY